MQPTLKIDRHAPLLTDYTGIYLFLGLAALGLVLWMFIESSHECSGAVMVIAAMFFWPSVLLSLKLVMNHDIRTADPELNIENELLQCVKKCVRCGVDDPWRAERPR